MLRRRRAGRGNLGLESLAGILARSSPDQRAPNPNPLPPRVWELAVGARVAERAFPVRLTRGQLTVRVASSAWAQELAMLAPTIQKRLLAQGVPVQDLRFTVRSAHGRPPKPKPPEIRRIPARYPLPSSIQGALARVPDMDLRGVIARAAEASLAWQRAFRGDTPSSASTAPARAAASRATASDGARPKRAPKT